MTNRSVYILCAVAAAFIYLIAFPNPRKPIAIDAESPELLRVGEEQVRAQAKDPDAVKFGEEWVGKLKQTSVACGRFNGKNSFGAYTGSQRFLATHVMAITEETGGVILDGMWAEACAPYQPR